MNYNDFFELAKQQGITNIQVTEFTTHDIDIEYIDEKLKNHNSSFIVSYQIKAEKENKTVKITSDYLDKNVIDLLLTKIKYTDTSYSDEYLIDKSNNNNIDLNTIDISEEQKELRQIYKLKEKFEYVKSITTNFVASSEKMRIINSNGVDMSTSSEIYRIYCEVLLEKDDIPVTHRKSLLKVKKEELKINEFVNDLIEEAQKMLTKEKIITGKYDIILSNKVVSSILAKVMRGINANNIREKTSIFGAKLNKKIFNESINIVEDPLNKKLPGYTLFDNEGTKTVKKEIIKHGILKTYLYDIKEAKLVNKQSTGNSYNGISTRNLFLSPGEFTSNELLKIINNGLYITDFMGSQGTAININSGSISIQVFGFIIKDGKIKCGFIPCIMTTTIEELFNNVKSIGSDLEFFSKSSGAPSILVTNISIAGK